MRVGIVSIDRLIDDSQATFDADGNAYFPDGRVRAPDGTVAFPDGTVIDRTGVTLYSPSRPSSGGIIALAVIGLVLLLGSINAR